MRHLAMPGFDRIGAVLPSAQQHVDLLAAGERAWSEVAPRFQFLIAPNRTTRCRFTFKFALRRNVRTICEICDPGHRLVAAEEPCYGNGRSTMTEQSSLQPASRGNGRRPDSLVRLGTAALVRLATAALALVVAMLVINPLASGRPLT